MDHSSTKSKNSQPLGTHKGGRRGGAGGGGAGAAWAKGSSQRLAAGVTAHAWLSKGCWRWRRSICVHPASTVQLAVHMPPHCAAAAHSPLPLHRRAPHHLERKLLPALHRVMVQRQPRVHCGGGGAGRERRRRWKGRQGRVVRRGEKGLRDHRASKRFRQQRLSVQRRSGSRPAVPRTARHMCEQRRPRRTGLLAAGAQDGGAVGLHHRLAAVVHKVVRALHARRAPARGNRRQRGQEQAGRRPGGGRAPAACLLWYQGAAPSTCMPTKPVRACPAAAAPHAVRTMVLTKACWAWRSGKQRW